MPIIKVRTRDHGNALGQKVFVRFVNALFILMAAIASCAFGTKVDNEAVIKGMHYANAYNVGSFEKKEAGTFTIRYDVDLKYPSKAVLEYYDSELRKLGWIEFSDPNYKAGYRTWSNFEDATQKGEPLVHQLAAEWTNEKKTRMIMLVIRYISFGLSNKYDLNIEPNNGTQHVYLQIMPFTTLPAK